MKTIMIDGPDRCGKNKLIEYLCSTADNYIVRHFGNPKGNTNNEKIKYQEQDFLTEFRFNALTEKNTFLERTATDLFIHNRSHLGEWVYGQIYRNYSPKWIWEYENLFRFNQKNIYLILLYADADFLISKEDGHSISDKLENRLQELDLFHEAYYLSIIPNKIKIKVNNENEYISFEEIKKQINEFLNIT